MYTVLYTIECIVLLNYKALRNHPSVGSVNTKIIIIFEELSH